jgi:hypothetical protein
MQAMLRKLGTGARFVRFRGRTYSAKALDLRAKHWKSHRVRGYLEATAVIPDKKGEYPEHKWLHWASVTE